MPSARKDLLSICNDQGTPIDQFKMMFCDRCMQQECTRSRSGESKFEHRVKNWQRELFSSPPRMDPNDPRFTIISAQKFLTIDTSPMPEVRTGRWVDPRDLTEQTAPMVVAAPKLEVPKAVPIVETPKAAPVVEAPRVPARRVQLPPMNTPAQKGMMIGEAPAPKAKDPWATPEAPKSGEVVLSPGAKVTVGGTGSGPTGV